MSRFEGLNRGFSPGRPSRLAVLLAEEKKEEKQVPLPLRGIGMTECGRRTTQKEEKQILRPAKSTGSPPRSDFAQDDRAREEAHSISPAG